VSDGGEDGFDDDPGGQRLDDLAPWTDDIEVVTFSKNPEPTRTDPIGRYPLDGSIIFPDKKRGGDIIRAGDTYFCLLHEYVSPTGSTVYYAEPVARVDATFLFDLRPDQVARMVDGLEATAQRTLLEQARAKIKKSVEEAVKGELDRLQKEREAAVDRSEGLEEDLARLRDERATLRMEVEGLEHRVSELEEDTDRGVHEVAEPPGEASDSWHMLGPAVGAGRPLVRRRTEEVLGSAMFRDGLHFVHVSPDRRLLRVYAHPEGNLPAVGGRLKVPGLGTIRPFAGEEELPARVDPSTGAILVDLTGR